MIFKIIGGLLAAWGVMDIGFSYSGTDIWLDWLGIDLWSINQFLGKYIGWIEIVLGSVIWNLSGRRNGSAEEHE